MKIKEIKNHPRWTPSEPSAARLGMDGSAWPVGRSIKTAVDLAGHCGSGNWGDHVGQSEK